MSDLGPTETPVRRTLEARGEGVRVVGDLAERAIARDRSNRRRQLGGAALAAGVALAVALPVGWNALRPTGGAPVPAGPSQSTSVATGTMAPSPTPSESPSTASSTRPATVPTILSTGAPSAAVLAPASGPSTTSTDVGYVRDGVFHLGSRTIVLGDPFRRPGHVAALGDGVLVTAGARAAVLAADGTSLRELPSLQGPLRVDPAGTRALVADTAGDLLLLDATGRELRRLPASAPGRVGWEPVHLGATHAYAVTGDQTTTVVWDLGTGRTTTMKGAVSTVDPSGTRAVVTDPTQPVDAAGHWCQRLVDLTRGSTVWTVCGPLTFTAFSPDGAYLLGTGWSDGQPPEVSLRDGKPIYQQLVVARTDDASVILQGGDGSLATGWVATTRMGASNALTVQLGTADQQRNLQRCTLDGACRVVGEAAAPWQPDIGPDSDGPYVLSEH